METFHTPIQLKGTGGGLRLFIPEELAEEEIMLELERISKEAGALLGLQVILDFQGRKLSQSLV
ncbi:MAG TPA: hypothetical protein DEP01_00555, partial [Aminobacterium sp.]|nr:hypothetical protein [Aminobacterium sp.]